MRYDRSRAWPAALLGLALLSGCGGDSGGDDSSTTSANPVGLAPIAAERVFDPDGMLEATLRYTTGGVPHITADNLESAGFGEGYAQARDNICLIAEQIIKARSERALFFGPGIPGAAPGSPQASFNIIKDFSYKALGILSGAQATYDQLSAASRALLEGFAAGYNKYLEDTGVDNLSDPRCSGQPWVRPITPQELYAYYRIIALYASGDLFTTGVLFAAHPPGVSPAPRPVMRAAMSAPQRSAAHQLVAGIQTADLRPLGLQQALETLPLGMGSNGWGIGSELTESGNGALLANPHFPYLGPRRLWQSQLTVPGVYNVNGATLTGFPLPLIGFNGHLAWTHTVSTSNRFTAYVLVLAAGGLSYVKNDQARPITKKTFQIQVATGAAPITLEKDFYYSEYGPMIAAELINPAFPAWGDVFGG
ncbi:MAG: penicillin acylase family protein, partial [Salinisphaera sp.]|nr:penicillin acylase family protein [Salinisphaera sp.]